MKDLKKLACDVGFEINVKRINSMNIDNIMLHSHLVELVDNFCHIGSIKTKNDGAETDIHNRLSKAKARAR